MAAAALECVHCYSLVHDDLPAMDNDDLRRGRPTVHKAFDEATAILAGDSLLTFAFDILSRTETHPDPAIRIALVAALARASGLGGMAGGQMLDLAAEGRFAASAAASRARRGRGAAGDEDRRAAALRLPRRRDPGRRRGRPARTRSTASERSSVRRSRSPTTFSTSKATRRRSARRPARTPALTRRPRSPFSESSGRSRSCSASSPRPRRRWRRSGRVPPCSRQRPASSPNGVRDGRPDARRDRIFVLISAYHSADRKPCLKSRADVGASGGVRAAGPDRL